MIQCVQNFCVFGFIELFYIAALFQDIARIGEGFHLLCLSL